MKQHDWTLHVGTRGDSLLGVAICRACGIIRRRDVAQDHHIDLRGECPGEPQESEERSEGRASFG